MTETSKALSQSNKEYANNKTVVDAATGSNEQLRARLSLLTKEYNGLSKEQRENSASGKQMQATIKTLSDKLKENEKAVGDNRRNVGNYEEAIKKALGSVNIMGVNVGDLVDQLNNQSDASEDASKSSGLFSGGLKGMAAGLKSATIASLQFLATPIGAAIAAVALAIGLAVGGFKLMAASLNRTEDGAAALSGVMNVFKGIMGGVLQVIQPIALFLVKGLANGFEMLGAIVEKTSKAIESAMRFVGMENAANGLAKVTTAIKETSIATAQLAKAEAELNKIQREQGKIQLDYQNRAEKLRQIRDDESKSMKERIQANKDLGAVLTEQSNSEMKLAKRSLEIAKLRIKADGANTENLDKKAEAELKIAEIEERITSQRSEQMTNENH
jgi:chromosome segregation ATPase